MAAFDPKTIAAALRVTGNNQLADELEDPTRQAPQSAPALSQADTTWASPPKNPYNAVVPGNIDLTHRPHVRNADGSQSTIRSMGFQDERGQEVLIPTVSNRGTIMTPDEAIDEYYRTGQHLGVFRDPKDSDRAGELMHLDQEKSVPTDTLSGSGGKGMTLDQINEERKRFGEPPLRPQDLDPSAPAYKPESIENKTWNPNAGRGQLQREVAQGQQRVLDLTTKKGEVGAQGAAQQAELYGQLEGQRKQRNDTSVGRVEGNRAQKDALEKEMFRKLDEISEREKNPPKDVMGMVIGILGAAMTAKGNSGGAVAAQMIGQAMGSKSQQWARELESDKAAIGRMKTMFDLQNDDSNNELAQEQQISALLAGQFDAALKKVGTETESKELRANAEAARNELRSKFAQHQLAVEQKKAAASGSDALWKLSVEQLSSMMANGQLGKEGQAVLTEKIKREQGQRGGEAEIEGKLAGAEKARADAIKAANEAGQPGAKKLTEGEAKTDAVVGGAVDSYMRLARNLAGGGEVNRGATKSTWVPDMLTSQETLQQRADTTNLVRSILRVESGSNVPESEVEGKIEALGLNSGDPEIRAQGYRQLLSGFKAIDRQGRLAAKEQATRPAPQQAAPTQPATSTAQPVIMYRPDGKPVPVQPQFVEQAAARGWSTEPPSQQQPALTSGVGLEQRMASERSAR